MADFEAAIQAGQNLSEPEVIEEGGIPFVTLGQTVHSLERFCAYPRRARGTFRFLDFESFAEFVDRFTSEDTVVFYRKGWIYTRFTAIFDFHTPAPKRPDPNWCLFRAVAKVMNAPDHEAINNRFKNTYQGTL